MRGKIRYVVDIVGDDDPFHWHLKRIEETGTTSNLSSGTASTYQDAMFDAAEAGHDAEAKRRHASTKQREELFTVDLE